MIEKMKGKLRFDSVDPYVCRFTMEKNPKIRSNPRMDFVRDVLPPDYEPEKYTVEGSYVIEITVKEKK